MKKKLSRRLTIIFIGLATIPLIIVGILLAQRNYAIVSGHAIGMQSEVAQRVAKDVKDFIGTHEKELLVLTKIRNVLLQDKEEQLLALTGLMASQNTYRELSVLDPNGDEVVRIGTLRAYTDDELQSRAGMPEFEAARASGQIYYSPVQFDEATGESYLVIAVPSFDVQSGQFAGVLVANISFNPVWDMMSSVRMAGDGIVYLVDAENRVVAHRDPGIVLQGTQYAMPEEDGFYAGLSGAETAVATSMIRFGAQEFYTVAELGKTEALSLAISTSMIIGLVFIVSLFMAIVISVIITRQIRRMNLATPEMLQLATDSAI